MLNLKAIAAYYGGDFFGNSVNIPTPGHSPQDRGTTITYQPDAPDKVLVHCHNGTHQDALMVKDMLRTDGFLPAWQEAAAPCTPEVFINLECLKTSDKVAKIMQQASPARLDHSYLQRKGICNEGLYQIEDRLIVPLKDLSGQVLNAQEIGMDGSKKFLPKHPVKGLFWSAGDISGEVVIAEGMATAAAVRRATGCSVVAAMSAANIPQCAKAFKEAGAIVFVAADNDMAGIKAANNSGCSYYLPPVEGQDFADISDEQIRAVFEADPIPPLSSKAKKGWLISAAEMLANVTPPRWLLKGIIEEQTFGMIYGASGCGKSHVTIDMAMHLASGMPSWHGHDISSPRPVVYLAGEGHSGMSRRMAAWIKHHKRSTDIPLHVSQSGCDLDTDEGYASAFNAISELERTPSLIIVDTLHRFLSGDENSAKDARAMIDACGRLQSEFRCTVILVHHTGVSQDAQHRARGSSAWKGAVDFEFSIEFKSETIMMTSRKVKDGPEPTPHYFKLHEVVLDDKLDEDGQPASSVVLVPTESVQVDNLSIKITKFLNWFESAWLKSGEEYRDGKPYVSRAAMLDYLTGDQARLERTAKNDLTPSRDGSLIHELIKAEIVEVYEDGWILIDPVHVSVLNICKNAKTDQ